MLKPKRTTADTIRTLRVIALVCLRVAEALDEISDAPCECECPRCRAARGVTAEGKPS